MIAVLSLLAQNAGGDQSRDIFDYLIQIGVAGIVIVLFLAGYLWAKPAVDRLIKDKERAEAQRDELLRVYEEKMLPALSDSIVVTRDLKPIIQEVTTVLAQVKGELARGPRQ